ncbi:MAG: aspartate kinase [Alphaproteobacteria bacterium]
MALLVAKFGGTSVGTIERIKHAAAKIAAEAKQGHRVAVVVSAMSGETDRLIGLCHAISPLADPEESDVVIASGEQVSSGLMALALQQRGLRARAWQGWQIPLTSDGSHGRARIENIAAERLLAHIEDGEIPVMAGFQGVTPQGRVTTLGRGGSDTSAVALAAALKADRCDIYTDVDGVYTSDPRIVAHARKLRRISFEEMLELASLGAKVLQTRSVELAMRYRVPVQVLSAFADDTGSDLPGTLLTNEDVSMESQLVTGIAHSRNEAKIALTDIPDRPGMAAAIFSPLAEAGVNVDMIVQTASNDSKATDMTFSVTKSDLARTVEILTGQQREIGYVRMLTDPHVVKISIVGLGMRSHAGVAATMFRTLAEKGINIQVISTSEIKTSVLIAEDYMELAVRSLHTAYGLDGA